MTKRETLPQLAVRARACAICADRLPLGPRPTFQVKSSARLLLVGQAPGTRVHETGIPWNDRSGDRLRDWLGLDRDAFYDETKIAILPMGLCYPGVDSHGGDLPPVPTCAPLWHPQFARHLGNIGITLLIGSYAQRYYLRDRRKSALRDTVAAWRSYLPDFVPLPHPSWRNTAWLRKNPWFEAELVPELRRRVAEAIGA